MNRVKKTLLALLLGLILLPLSGYGQERKNVIKANPFALAFGGFNATYERVLDSKSSLLFSGSYASNILDTKLSAVGVGTGYRYYFTHAKTEVPTGFYVNPQLSFEFGNIKESGSLREHIFAFSIGAQLGYQWAWQNGFTLDLGIGPNYAILKSNETISGIIPAGTLAIGFAF